MFEKALVMYIYAETPIHHGSGVALGAVDLPIQRERHTEFPIIQGSSLKGVLRNVPKGTKKNSDIALSEKCEDCPKKENDVVKELCKICGEIFGIEEGIGGISVTDARMLAFPVRTLKGVFAWITCPLALDRYKRDLSLAEINGKWNIPKPTSNEEAKVCKTSNITEKYVYIEDLQLKCTEDENVNKIAEEISNALPDNDIHKEIKEKIKKDLVIVSDEVFRDLVSLTTEVVARIKIDPVKGTVERGALWSEEYLPTDTITYSLLLIPRLTRKLTFNGLDEKIKKEIENIEESEKIRKILEKLCDEKILHIGGDETIGKGFARIKIIEWG